MPQRPTITMVTLDANGNRLLHEVDADTKRDVDQPEPTERSAPSWQNGYPYGTGYKVS